MREIIPDTAANILRQLNAAGYEAFLVGGCVRDFLMGNIPHDWDITTSALPQQVKQVFSGAHIIDTGLQHGTVSLIDGHEPYEITTYRIDSDYSDSRHPDKVSFTTSLKEDLKRRDFTINALAYHPKAGVIDFFDGVCDIEKQVIRCVGDPEQRFQEDALRIMRAVRFAAKLGFSIAPSTKQALFKNKALLSNIAAERKTSELLQILCGGYIRPVILDYYPVLSQIIPQLSDMANFEQHNPYHIYDVLEHTAHAVSEIESTPVLRLTMLLHDIGKPSSFSMDDKHTGHFYGHDRESVRIAEKLFAESLRLDKTTANTALTLIRYHDMTLGTSKSAVLKWLNRLGEDMLRMLLKVKRADILAQNPSKLDRLDTLAQWETQMNSILQERNCFTLQQLDISGKDLIEQGIPQGKQIGIILNALLNDVIEDRCPNENAALRRAASKYSH